jgi:hypothetical protein
MARLLVVHHSPTRSLQLPDRRGARRCHDDDEIEGVEVVVKARARGHRGRRPRCGRLPARHHRQLRLHERRAQALLRLDLPRGRRRARRQRSDVRRVRRHHGEAAVRALRARALRPTGAVRSVTSIVGALGWKQGYDVLEVLGEVTDAHTEAAYELGGTIAALTLSEHLRPTTGTMVPAGCCALRTRRACSSWSADLLVPAAAGGPRRRRRPGPGRLGRGARASAPAGARRPQDVGGAEQRDQDRRLRRPHTAETYAVGRAARPTYEDAAYDAGRSGRSPTRPAAEEVRQAFLGADESLVMRTVVSWAWFRPSEKAWDEGARWYRCDVVGGGEAEQGVRRPAPTPRKGCCSASPDDRWMVCATALVSPAR